MGDTLCLSIVNVYLWNNDQHNNNCNNNNNGNNLLSNHEDNITMQLNSIFHDSGNDICLFIYFRCICDLLYVHRKLPPVIPLKIYDSSSIRNFICQLWTIFPNFSTPCVHLIRDLCWVFKTTFGLCRRWS